MFKKIILIIALLFVFIAVAEAGKYLDVTRSTTTELVDWRIRGDMRIGTSTGTADANVVIRGTGTVELLTIVFSDGSSQTTAGGGLISDLAYGAGWNGEVSSAPTKNAVYDQIELVMVSTGAIQVEVDALEISTGAIQAEVDALEVSTGTNATAIALNTVHKTSVGTDHGYIDQSVTITSSPTFAGATIGNSTFTVLSDGTNFITEISTDGTGSGNSDHALPTEQATREMINYFSVSPTTGAVLPVLVRNTIGRTIAKGIPISFVGSLGQLPTFVVTFNTNTAGKECNAITAESISNNSNGLAYVMGVLSSFDTSGFTAGDHLFAGSGVITNTYPTSGRIQHIGHCLRSNVSGSIYIQLESAEPYIAATSGENLDLRMGATDGSTAVLFENYLDVIVATMTDQGNLIVKSSGTFGGRVGIGRSSPDSALHIKASVSGLFGQIILQTPADNVESNVAITAYESDGSGDLDQQLWYLGNSSGSNEDITFLNRRDAKLTLGTSGYIRITISGGGLVEFSSSCHVTGNVVAAEFHGDGSNLTGTNTSMIVSTVAVGIISTANLATDRVEVSGDTMTGSIYFDDGFEDSPYITMRDEDNKLLRFYKNDDGYAEIFNNETPGGVIRIATNNDINDLFYFDTVSDVPYIRVFGTSVSTPSIKYNDTTDQWEGTDEGTTYYQLVNEGFTASNDGAKTTLLATTGDYMRIGDANSTSHSFNSEDDLVVTGKLEINGETYPDNFVNYGVSRGPSWGNNQRIMHIATDVNARCLFLEMATGGAIYVPVFIIGEASANSNLGWFDGITEPRICLVDDDGDSGVTFGFDVTDDTPTIAFKGNANQITIKSVLTLNPISTPPVANMPQGSMYFDSDDYKVYVATSAVNLTTGEGWKALAYE